MEDMQANYKNKIDETSMILDGKCRSMCYNYFIFSCFSFINKIDQPDQMEIV